MENRKNSIVSRVLSIAIILALLGTAIALYRAVKYPPPIEKFTEFYLLDLESRTAIYPESVKAGEAVALLVGIVNHEKITESYRVETWIDGANVATFEAVSLANGEKFEQRVTFALNQPGDKQRVDFLLFKAGRSEPYATLYLYISAD